MHVSQKIYSFTTSTTKCMYKAHTKYVEPNCLATQTGNVMGDFFYIYYEGFNDVLKMF